MRSAISAAPSSAAFEYFACQAFRSSATVSRASRRSSLSSGEASGAGISSPPILLLADSVGAGASFELGGAASDELGSEEEEVRAELAAGVADAEETDDVGLVKEEATFAAVLSH